MIAHQFPPTQSAGVFRTVRFVKYLPEFGWTPIVLTAAPDDTDATSGSGPSLAVPADVPVIRTPPSRASKPSFKRNEAPPSDDVQNGRRPGGSLTIARKAWRLLTETPDRHVRWIGPAVRRGRSLLSETQADALYTTGPPHSVHLAGAILKHVTGRAWIADFRDPWARRPWQKHGNPWGERWLCHLERYCVRTADAVILNTDRAADDFLAAYPDISPRKFHVIPNGCDPDIVSFAANVRRDDAPRRGSEYRVLHPGSCYSRRDPRPVIDAIAELARQGLHARFEQVGPCSDGLELAEYARSQGVADRVTVEPPVPHTEILERMAAADALLLIQPDAPLMVPGKLYEMLPFRKPIIALTDTGATADLIRRFDLGTVVPSTDTAGLTRSLADLMLRRDADGSAAKRNDALRAFDGRALTGELASVLASAAVHAVPRGRRASPVRLYKREAELSQRFVPGVAVSSSSCEMTEP